MLKITQNTVTEPLKVMMQAAMEKVADCTSNKVRKDVILDLFIL